MSAAPSMSSPTKPSRVTKYTADPSAAEPTKLAAVALVPSPFAVDTGTTNQLSAPALAAPASRASSTTGTNSSLCTRSVLAADVELDVRRVRARHGPGVCDRYAGEGGCGQLRRAVRAARQARASDGVALVRELLGVVGDRVRVP